jgi:hypothetical protein
VLVNKCQMPLLAADITIIAATDDEQGRLTPFG